MKALLLAAGLGTRLKPFTDKHPKALAQVNGKSLLEWNVRMLQQFGIFDVVVNVHHFADQIEAALYTHSGYGSRFELSDEREAVLETGGGLRHATRFFEKETCFLAINVDILTNAALDQLIEQHLQTGALVTLAVQQRSSSRYFLFNEQQRLCGWEQLATGAQKIPVPGLERSSLHPLAFSGIQVINASIFDKIGLTGKFSLVDLYLSLCAEESLLAWEHTGDLLLDVGKPESLQQAATLFS